MKTARDFYYNQNNDIMLTLLTEEELPEEVFKLMDRYANHINRWIPIEEFNLIDGEVYDIYSSEFGRVCSVKFSLKGIRGHKKPLFKERLIIEGTSIYYLKSVTHIMKVPNNPGQ